MKSITLSIGENWLRQRFLTILAMKTNKFALNVNFMMEIRMKYVQYFTLATT